VTGDQLKARRHAREVVAGMRWRGMTMPVVYARMADEFEDLVRSGEYTDWVAANQKLALLGRKAHVAGPPGPCSWIAPEQRMRLPALGGCPMSVHLGVGSF
jgi:hypothetical protein